MLQTLTQRVKAQVRRMLAVGLLLMMLTIATPAQAAESRSINQVLQQLAQGWEQGDVAMLKALWPETEPQATYMSVESDAILQGMAAIDQYYEETVPAFDVIKVTVSNATIDQIGDLAHVAANSNFVLQNPDGSRSEVQPRLSLTLKKVGDRWSLLHYAEAAKLDFD